MWHNNLCGETDTQTDGRADRRLAATLPAIRDGEPGGKRGRKRRRRRRMGEEGRKGWTQIDKEGKEGMMAFVSYVPRVGRWYTAGLGASAPLRWCMAE